MSDDDKAKHCRHCDSERPGWCYASKEFGFVHVSTEPGGWHAHWVDGHCPMCAEGERVAKWCEERAERVRSEPTCYYDDRGDRAAIYERVAEIARGDR